MKKKILAILLVAMMVVSILPVSAFAEAAEEVTATCPGADKTHSLTNCSEAVEKATVEGDCTAWGYTIYECPVCGADFADDFVEPTKAHKVSNPTEEAVAATCTEPGKTAAGVCDVCGTEVKSEAILPTGHKKADDDKGTATKTEDGKCGVAYKCVTCGETFVVASEEDHVWGKTPVIVVEPGYYTWGEAEYTCTACSATKIVAVRPEHKCTKVTHVAEVKATCEKDGNIEYWQCNECKVMYSDAELETVATNVVVPALGHDFSQNIATGKTYTTTIKPSDSYKDKSGKDLTNGKYGNQADAYDWVGFNGTNPAIVVDLGEVRENLVSFSVNILHLPSWGINAPKGVEVQVSEDNTTWTTVATSSNEIYNTTEVKSYTLTVEAVAPVDARYVKFVLTNASNWTFVSEVEVDAVKVAENGYVPSTCVKNGSLTVDCLNGCGKTEKIELPLAPHEYDPKPLVSVKPTCVKYGFELYACTVCGDIKTVDTLAPKGHTPYACSVHTDKADANCVDCTRAATSTNKVKVDPTCTKNGSLTWNCGECGEEQTAVLNATGCNVKTVTVAATCRQYGYTFTYCTNACDAKDVVLGATSATVTSADKKLTATVDVTVKGEAVNLLSVVVDFEGGFDPDNHTRDNSESYYLVAPTCTTGGTDVFFCAYCDFYAVLDVDALGHDFTMLEDGSNWEVKTQQTCTTAETWTVYCTKDCTVKDKDGNDVKVSTVVTNEEKPALGHEYADASKVKPTVTNPTCIGDGYKFYDCLRCSANDNFDAACDKLVEKLDKLVNKTPVDGREEVFNSKTAAEAVHAISSWTVLRQGDCQIVGLEVAKCDHCGLDILAVIPDTGHHVAPGVVIDLYNDANNYWAYPYGVVSFNSAYLTTADYLPNWWQKAWVTFDAEINAYVVVAKAGADGKADYLDWDLADGDVVIAAHSESGMDKTVAALKVGDIVSLGKLASCPYGDGYTAAYNCALCGETVKSEVIKHTANKVVDKVAVDPTCTENGATEGWHCTECNYKVASTVVPATGHVEWTLIIDEQVYPTCTTFGFYYAQCNECGHEELWNYHKALGHDFSVVKTPVGCLTDGTLGCSRCDATENVEAKGHVMTVKVDGKDTKVYYGFCDQEVPADNKCEVCEAVVKAGDALAHRQTSLNEVEVAATCVEYGYYLTTCDDCEWYSMVKIDKLADHQIVWDDTKYVAPTFNAAGSKTGTCSVCKGEFTEEIKALGGIGYNVTLDNAVVAGAELVDSATLAVTVSIDGNNADIWGVRFNVEYDKAVLKFAKAEFVTDTYNVLGEANDNGGYVTVVANLSNKDGSAVTLNAESALVVLYFTVDTANKTVEDSVVAVKSVEAINTKSEAVAVSNEGSAKFDVAPYLDANDDGAVNLADALYIYNIVTSGSGVYDASVDVDKDGAITMFDFIAVYKYLTGEFVYADMVNGGVKVEAPKA